MLRRLSLAALALTCVLGVGCGSTSDDPVKQANDLIAQVQKSIKESKLDDATAAMTKLDALKAKVSPELAKRIDDTKALLDKAKGVKIPGT